MPSPTDTLPPVYTIGYGQRTAEELVALLHRYGVAMLVDVRSAPYSRHKPEFNKDALAAALEREPVARHRSLLAQRLADDPGLPVQHLMPP